MTTANDIINSALRLIGELAESETPTFATANDALEAMNTMIDSWSIERLSVFSTQDQVFSWPANQATRTLGPSGNFVGNRPVQLDGATYFVDTGNNLSFGILIINQEQYDGIALKSVTSTYPEVIFVNYEMPNITMTIYPVPTKALQWHFISISELTQPALLSTTLVFPPGYKRAFKYNLAVEIATEFGIEPPRTVARIAMASKRNLKRINSPLDVMSMPYVLVQNLNRFNIYSNQPS